MAQVRAWLSGMVNAVHSRNSQQLQQRLDWNDSVANSCAEGQFTSAAQVDRQATDTFRPLNNSQAAKWAAFAAAHMLALVSDKNGQLLVRPTHCIACAQSRHFPRFVHQEQDDNS